MIDNSVGKEPPRCQDFLTGDSILAQGYASAVAREGARLSYCFRSYVPYQPAMWSFPKYVVFLMIVDDSMEDGFVYSHLGSAWRRRKYVDSKTFWNCIESGHGNTWMYEFLCRNGKDFYDSWHYPGNTPLLCYVNSDFSIPKRLLTLEP